ncbi:hypothetical protein NX871_32870, partial [Burkholderia thailandensis]|uniref:hypothetical protein n=1 Tax=Burkholderia thailandensis TaxID=57975 RepID=UPI00217E26B1
MQRAKEGEEVDDQGQMRIRKEVELGEERESDEQVRKGSAVNKKGKRVERKFREWHTWQKDACIVLLL